ncbi:WD40-repeat-containing domain protein [Flagelloscypha sp. PMI_526]|nr:WD40-repeat-containing domain protein [Flagelloscypha sp. PMI_526]
MSFEAEVVYTALSTNRFPYAADVSESTCIAFGSGKLIGLWDPSNPGDVGVFKTLSGHGGLVTSVRFLTNEVLVSGDDSGYLFLWRSQSREEWNIVQKIQAHGHSISCITSLHGFVVTGSSDSSLKVWTVTDSLEHIQTIRLGGKYPIAVALSSLPGSTARVLAVSGTDRNIQLWVKSSNEFIRSATLPGHEDWIRSLAFKSPTIPGDALLLASGSQDGAIRLWKILPVTNNRMTAPQTDSNILSDDLLNAFEDSLGDIRDNEDDNRQISLKRYTISIADDIKFSVTFDALLVGHEAGITRLSWQRPLDDSPPTLMSTSTDSSVILWSPSSSLHGSSEDSSIWMNRQRFGDIGGQRLGGFVGGLWGCGDRDLFAWGWSGGWRRWHSESTNSWVEKGAITGHVGPAKTLSWSPCGAYCLTVGQALLTDQTTRIHGSVPGPGKSRSVWHEISRPQVHGYDMIGAEFLDDLRFVSIGDEKVARVFEAPRGFVDTVEALQIFSFTQEEHNRPEAANVPPLGLSNKAVTQDNVGLTSDTYLRRPFDGELASSTLWPELEKIYGHGYESISLTVSSSRHLIATVCKSTTPEHAGIRLYNTTDWRPVGNPLMGHTLTVTRIAFSPNDKYILSVSRDRSWRIHTLDETTGVYLPSAHDKTHGRIIWDCAWSPKGTLFATASRDKTVKIWGASEAGAWSLSTTLKMNEAATAVDFKERVDGRLLLAIGLETGSIVLYSLEDSKTWTSVGTIDQNKAHIAQINRLSFRPSIKDTTGNDNPLYLGTCSDDGAIRVLLLQEV